MGLYEELRQLSEQVKKRQGHIKGEEATKQALVLPFLHVLGYDIYDPTVIRPEYIADFAKKKANGQFEKIDYALYIKEELGILVECKSIEAKPQDHDGQLARYFNALESVRVGVLTDGLIYRFFTDLRAPNRMDEVPFLEFNILSFNDRDAEALRPFTREGFDSNSVQRYAEEVISMDKITVFVDDLLRNPNEDFARFILSTLDLVPGRITEKVIDRFMPMVKKSVQSALLGMMTKSIQQEIAPPIVETVQSVPLTRPIKEVAPEKVAAPAKEGLVVTTEEELEIFRIVSRLCGESKTKVPISYKDTVSYFGINIGGVKSWFLRIFVNGPRKFVVTRLPVEQVTNLAPGFEVEATSENIGRSRVFFKTAADFDRLRALVIVAYEEKIKTRDASDEPA